MGPKCCLYTKLCTKKPIIKGFGYSKRWSFEPGGHWEKASEIRFLTLAQIDEQLRCAVGVGISLKRMPSGRNE
jgi:hypothetical protein